MLFFLDISMCSFKEVHLISHITFDSLNLHYFIQWLLGFVVLGSPATNAARTSRCKEHDKANLNVGQWLYMTVFRLLLYKKQTRTSCFFFLENWLNIC